MDRLPWACRGRYGPPAVVSKGRRMRITGGTWRGRRLRTLPGKEVRPTSDKVRQALFNILGARVTDAAVLDLFAGSGSLGLEALSRGAARATFVETGRRALEVIRRNVETLACEGRVTVRRIDLLASPAPLRELDGPFDVVFIDPPYRVTETVDPGSKLGTMLEMLWRDGVAGKGGLVVLEHDRRATLSEAWRDFRVSDTRTWGDTSVSFFVGKES